MTIFTLLLFLIFGNLHFTSRLPISCNHWRSHLNTRLERVFHYYWCSVRSPETERESLWQSVPTWYTSVVRSNVLCDYSLRSCVWKYSNTHTNHEGHWVCTQGQEVIFERVRESSGGLQFRHECQSLCCQSCRPSSVPPSSVWEDQRNPGFEDWEQWKG